MNRAYKYLQTDNVVKTRIGFRMIRALIKGAKTKSFLMLMMNNLEKFILLGNSILEQLDDVYKQLGTHENQESLKQGNPELLDTLIQKRDML